jgi:hypothetical protein
MEETAEPEFTCIVTRIKAWYVVELELCIQALTMCSPVAPAPPKASQSVFFLIPPPPPLNTCASRLQIDLK